MTSYMYYISDSHALLLFCYGNLIVPWFIHSFIPSIHLMLNGQRSLIYDNILLLCPRFLCMIVWPGMMGWWYKDVKVFCSLQRQTVFSYNMKLFNKMPPEELRVKLYSMFCTQNVTADTNLFLFLLFWLTLWLFCSLLVALHSSSRHVKKFLSAMQY